MLRREDGRKITLSEQASVFADEFSKNFTQSYSGTSRSFNPSVTPQGKCSQVINHFNVDSYTVFKTLSSLLLSAAGSDSYRLISLTSVACKVLERIIVSQLRSFLNDNKLLYDNQHEFVSGKLTTTNLLACDEEIDNCLNSNSSCDLILIDFARAFDKVSHHLLLKKL